MKEDKHNRESDKLNNLASTVDGPLSVIIIGSIPPALARPFLLPTVTAEMAQQFVTDNKAIPSWVVLWIGWLEWSVVIALSSCNSCAQLEIHSKEITHLVQTCFNIHSVSLLSSTNGHLMTKSPLSSCCKVGQKIGNFYKLNNIFIHGLGLVQAVTNKRTNEQPQTDSF